jgi:hypothetical protein
MHSASHFIRLRLLNFLFHFSNLESFTATSYHTTTFYEKNKIWVYIYLRRLLSFGKTCPTSMWKLGNNNFSTSPLQQALPASHILNMLFSNLLLARECHGLPWGFPGQPAPVPMRTHTHVHGCGFSWVRVMDFIKPTVNVLYLVVYW